VDNVGTIATINSGDGRGGDVSLSGGTISFTNGAQLLSSTGFDYSTSLATGTGPGGNVTVTGTDSILLSGVNPDLFAPSQIQSITYGGNGGNITVNVGTLSLTDGAVIWSNNSSLEPAGPDGNVTVGGNVTVQGLQGSGSAADAVTLNNVSIIKAETFNGPGRGGDVSITTHTMQMDIFSEVRTATLFGGGVGGNVFLNLGTLALKGGSVIRTQDFTFGTDLDSDGIVDIPSTGAGGHVTIQAGSADESVVLSGGSKIVSESLDGNGGALSITAPSVNLSEASSISSSTFGFGHGGEIVLNVQQASLSGGATIASAPAFFNPVAGEPGNITIQGLSGNGYMANALTLTGFPTGIIQDTYGTAHAGNIAVLAKTVSLTDAAVIEGGTRFGEGTGGNVTIDAISVSIASGSHISSEARAQASGPVTVTANQLTLNNGSIETTTISELPIGHGGNVELNVGSVSLANGAKIISGTSGVGQGGNITMTVGSLTLANQSEITSSSVGTLADAGNAGNVTITSSGAFTSNASTIATSAENARGGNIDVTAQSVALSNGAVMSASSRSPLLPDGGGNAGNIRITSASNVVMQNSSVTTEASHASGGSIEIDASDAGMVQLVNSQVSTSVKGVAKQSDGGNITIDPQFVVLQNSQVIAQANAGAGGAIDIIATSAFIADPASNVDASSTLGISGTINIQSPVQNVGGQLTPMPQEFSSAAALLAQQCAARVVDGKFSTFVVAGREGLPVEPGGFLASPSLTAELFGSSLSGRAPHTQLSAVTGLFPKYDARPIQLAKFGGACR
jgi:large exoprotein involved in heme utilization and adhesion